MARHAISYGMGKKKLEELHRDHFKDAMLYGTSTFRFKDLDKSKIRGYEPSFIIVDELTP